MIVCAVCTGRHHTSACPTAVRFVDQCFDGTPDEYQPLTDVAELLDIDAARRRRADRDRRDLTGMAERSRRRAARRAAYDATVRRHGWSS